MALTWWATQACKHVLFSSFILLLNSIEMLIGIVRKTLYLIEKHPLSDA